MMDHYGHRRHPDSRGGEDTRASVMGVVSKFSREREARDDTNIQREIKIKLDIYIDVKIL